MTDENPPPLPPRVRHIPGHTDHNIQQQEMQLWPHLSLSQAQPAPGVQAVPVGIGFNSRPQQQIWQEPSSAFSQRGWQPFPQAHTQQSPQESQELNPQVVRSQPQNWPTGEMNPIQLQQLQHLLMLQQQQQQAMQMQQQQQHHPQDQGLHHLDPIGHHEDRQQEKFAKSPSPQIEENRNSPAVGRHFMHNVTSPQQQVWQPVMHQYDLSHGDPQQSQAFQHTPVSHHQPLFAQQQYVHHQPVWQHHTPYSQNIPTASKPQNFNPNPSMSPYSQNLSSPNMVSKGLQGLYGSQPTTPRYPSPIKDRAPGPSPTLNQFRASSPGAVMRNHTPQGVVINNVYQRNVPPPPQGMNVHVVENVELNMFVQGLNPRTRPDSIQNYFEAVGKPACVKEQILFNMEHTEALIVFQQKPDMMKLKQNVKTRKLDGFNLEICDVPPPRCIVVSSESPIRSTEAVMLYFEREQIGGGPLKKGKMDETEDGCLLLEFEDPRVVQRLCSIQRTHKVDGVFLRISPYYQCENGAIWDMNMHVVPVPKPVNIQILPDQLEFVKKYSQPQFTSRLRDKYADVSFSKDHVTVKCMLRQAMPQYRQLAKGWDSAVQEAVANFLAENIDQTDIRVPENIWDKICDFLNSGRQELKDMLIKPNRERKSLKLVGFKKKENVKNAQKIIEEQVETFSRAARRKTETRKVKSAEHLAILDFQESFQNICKKFTDLVIHVEENEVTIEGDPADIPNAFIDIYAECDNVEPITYKHGKSREWVQFVKKESTRSYIEKKLEESKIKGCYTVNGTEISVFVPSATKSDDIRDVIVKSVLEESVAVEQSSRDLLNSEVWGDFLIDLKSRVKDTVDVFTKKLETVVVLGLDNSVPSVVKQIEEFLYAKTEKAVTVQCDSVKMDFISECWTEQDFKEIEQHNVVVKKKANGIELTGLSDNLIAGKQKLDAKLKKMCNKKHTLRKIGIHSVLRTAKLSGTITSLEKECKCVVRLPAALEEDTTYMLSDYEVVEPEFIAGDLNALSSGPKYFQTKKLKIKIQLSQKELHQIKTDIIVCSASRNLNLRSGAASYALVKAGGSQVQDDLTRMYPEGIKDGELAIVDGGKLHCDKIYLSSLPAWKEASGNGGKVFRDFMRECLRKADRHSKKSVAFVSMGTGGYLGYPHEVVASIMYGALVEFDKCYPKSSLREVWFALYSKDTETIKAFEDHERMRLYGTASLGNLSTDFVNGKIKIDLVDALLCSVSSDMNLTRSPICKSLVQNGGNSLQSLIDILQQVFQLANLKNLRSLAIPALGTGYLNYPKTIAARCMYDAVLDWAAKNPKASLKSVRFVMYNKDTEAQQAYRICHLRCQGREARLQRHFLGDGTVMATPNSGTKYRMVKDGCVLGPIQLNVSIGDILTTKAEAIVNGVGSGFEMNGAIAQALLKKCPNILPECQQKSSGPKQFTSESIAECLFTAIDDFLSSHPNTSLTEVRLLVHISKISSQPGILSALQGKTSAANAQSSLLGQAVKEKLVDSVLVMLYSDSMDNIDRCIKALEDKIGLGYSKKTVTADMDVIKGMSDSEIDNMVDPRILVDVKFDKNSGIFTLNGPSNQVSAAIDCIHNKMRQYKRQESTQELAKLLYSRIQWHWLCEDRTAQETKEKAYSELPNYAIEMAYKDNKDTVELTSKDGKVYIIDFKKLVEYQKLNKGDTVHVVRKDVLKAEQVQLPTSWMTMSNNENVKKVALPRGKEYSEVEREFIQQARNGAYSGKNKNSQNIQVVKIERIQNRLLYKQYMAKKKQMEQKLGSGTKIERKVWHGTTADVIPSIINNGFNRSYCGLHGTWYGQGVYFAADASYSCQSYLQGGKHSHMFLAKVLAGKFCKGKPEMRVLPAINPAKPEDVYDSAVDDTNKPMEFVIFHDTQAYPEYLITFM
ncbi:PAR14-like protein [Mya arenaria]|uniref:Poly [ADP-ribose] polymerase n=1 Tax=Mya arenaria TaxID=6604 RepID=A0ABY7DDJ8_MYAAR|nr:PAR14-like protein [Mya arenaria]